MDLKEKLKSLGIGVTESLILTLVAVMLTVIGINYMVEYFKPEYTGLFANTLTLWLENPLVVGLLSAGIRSLFGWLENFFANSGETYDVAKLAQTWTLYMGVITLFSQGFPMGVSVAIAVVADLIVRAIKYQKT